MRANQAKFPITTLCRLLEVSTSGYYAWVGRGPSKRACEDAELTTKIQEAHKASRGIYGAPRILEDLQEEGIGIGRKRVARLMRQADLHGVCRRKWVCTTNRAPKRKAAPDLVRRNFTAEGPNELWVADITYIPTRQGFLYLAVVLDVWSRRIVGWSMRHDMTTVLVEDALQMALDQRRARGVIHHSDSENVLAGCSSMA